MGGPGCEGSISISASAAARGRRPAKVVIPAAAADLRKPRRSGIMLLPPFSPGRVPQRLDARYGQADHRESHDVERARQGEDEAVSGAMVQEVAHGLAE